MIMSSLIKLKEKRISKVSSNQGWLQISSAWVKKIRDFQTYLKKFSNRMAIMIKTKLKSL